MMQNHFDNNIQRTAETLEDISADLRGKPGGIDATTRYSRTTLVKTVSTLVQF